MKRAGRNDGGRLAHFLATEIDVGDERARARQAVEARRRVYRFDGCRIAIGSGGKGHRGLGDHRQREQRGAK